MADVAPMDITAEGHPGAVKRDTEGHVVGGGPEAEEPPAPPSAAAVPPGFDQNACWAQMQACIGGSVKNEITAVVTRLGRLEEEQVNTDEKGGADRFGPWKAEAGPGGDADASGGPS